MGESCSWCQKPKGYASALLSAAPMTLGKSLSDSDMHFLHLSWFVHFPFIEITFSKRAFFCDREKVLGWIEEYIIKVGHTQQALNKGQVSL